MSYQDGNTRTSGERVSAVSDTAQQQATQVSHEVRSQARHVGRELQSQVSSKAAEEQHRIASALRDAGTELQSMSRSGERQDGLAHQLSEQLGQRTEKLADWLEDHEPQDILTEVTSFARRRPGAFLLSALTLGVVAGRATRGIAGARSDNGHAGQQTYEEPRYGDGSTPLYEELEAASAGYPTRPGEPMEPVPGLDAGTRARGLPEPERGTGRV